MTKIDKLNTKKLIHVEYELLEKVLKECVCDRVVRERNMVYKFYPYNHQIVRVDFLKGCKVVLNVKIVA